MFICMTACYFPITSFPTLYNFGVIAEGKLYRSNRPTLPEMEMILSHYPLRSVLYLGGEPLPDEEQFLIQQGIEFYHIPVEGCHLLDISKTLPILQNDHNYPMLIHCVGGADRTGRIVALYRLLFDGWTVSQALSEMRLYYGLKGEGESKCIQDIYEWVNGMPISKYRDA